MKILIYSTKDFEREYLIVANENLHVVNFSRELLSESTANRAIGYDVISVFAGDDASAPIIKKLNHAGIRGITIRGVGYDNVDIVKAKELGIRVANVPEYSPYAVAEHAAGMILALNRKLILADQQVHKHNYKIDNLIGFDLNRKKVGIIGTGRIGSVMAKIVYGFGCWVLAYDIKPNKYIEDHYGVFYTNLQTVCNESDIITIHTPLNEQTRYMVNKELIDKMKPGVILINTSRGAVVKTEDIIDALKTGRIAGLGMDVYEKENRIFFFDRSANPPQDEMLKELTSLPNVLITPHQAFATKEAIINIATTTFYNINCWAENKNSENELPLAETRLVKTIMRKNHSQFSY
jgi:D-lactate dehydrogenase